MWRNWNPLCTAKWCSHCGRHYPDLHKIDCRIILQPSNALSASKARRTAHRVSARYLNVHVHNSTAHNSQKMEEAKCPSANAQINKTWWTDPVECYSAFKRKGILTHAIIETNLEDIMLSEASQSQKHKDSKWCHLDEGPRAAKSRDRK
jgi:hypothetical protein